MNQNAALDSEDAYKKSSDFDRRYTVLMGGYQEKGKPTSAQYSYNRFHIYEPNYDAHIDPQHTGDRKTPSIDGAETLIDAAHLLRQTASAWSEADPVQAEVTVKTLGKFDSLPTLFTLVPGEMMKIDLSIWLEGQDADCTNRIEDAQIVADLRFGADYSAHGGLVDIPNGD